MPDFDYYSSGDDSEEEGEAYDNSVSDISFFSKSSVEEEYYDSLRSAKESFDTWLMEKMRDYKDYESWKIPTDVGQKMTSALIGLINAKGISEVTDQDLYFSQLVSRLNGLMGATPPLHVVILLPVQIGNDRVVADNWSRINGELPETDNKTTAASYANGFDELGTFMAFLSNTYLKASITLGGSYRPSVIDFIPSAEYGTRIAELAALPHLGPVSLIRISDMVRSATSSDTEMFQMLEKLIPFVGAVNLVASLTSKEAYDFVMYIDKPDGNGYVGFLFYASGLIHRREPHEPVPNIELRVSKSAASGALGQPSAIIESIVNEKVSDGDKDFWIDNLLYASLWKDSKSIPPTEGEMTRTVIERFGIRPFAESMAERSAMFGDASVLLLLQDRYGVNVTKLKIGPDAVNIVELAGIMPPEENVDRRPLVKSMLGRGALLPPVASVQRWPDVNLKALVNQLFTSPMDRRF